MPEQNTEDVAEVAIEAVQERVRDGASQSPPRGSDGPPFQQC